jgi:hypothetical protein
VALFNAKKDAIRRPKLFGGRRPLKTHNSVRTKFELVDTCCRYGSHEIVDAEHLGQTRERKLVHEEADCANQSDRARFDLERMATWVAT